MNIFRRGLGYLISQAQAAAEPTLRNSERLLILQAAQAASVNGRRDNLRRLCDVEFAAFSQWGEDGIIAWLADRLPSIPRTFVEFGVGDYLESNSRLLLEARNWRGVVLDGSDQHIQAIRQQPFYWRHELTAQQAFVNASNINDKIAATGVSGEIGLLSIDVDGNDYWIWKSINVVRPAIVIVEYNAVFGDRLDITIPYHPDFIRSAAHSSHLYFGASIRSLVSLGKELGYIFLGTTSTGCNAFFVRHDLAVELTQSVQQKCAFPSTVREARNEEGELTFVSGNDRIDVIKDMSVVVPRTGQTMRLDDIRDEIYSAQWAAGDCVEI
ncbi:hypothetical protein [Devosia alba]|uniref:hypothetical protein n=1 Tax=Devosia alba TaxID=3152360 RepID=UPI003263AEFF